MEHRGTYMVVFSPTAGMAWAFDRNYHFIGTESKYWAPITINDVSQLERGACCVSNLPVEEEDSLDHLRLEGHVVLTVWTNYFK